MLYTPSFSKTTLVRAREQGLTLEVGLRGKSWVAGGERGLAKGLGARRFYTPQEDDHSTENPSGLYRLSKQGGKDQNVAHLEAKLI